MALFHLPRTSSGNRLREHLGLSDVEYSKLAKVNICQGRWSLPAARSAADIFLSMGTTTVFVLLGAKVRAAFGGPAFFEAGQQRGHLLLALPHPSGLNRIWGEPDARSRARRLLRAAVPEIGWGTP